MNAEETLVPLTIHAGASDDLALVRFNFVPEGMSRSGAHLDIDTKTQQATFQGMHCEKTLLSHADFLKENKSFLFQGPLSSASPAEHILLFEPASGKVRLKKITKLINLKNVRNAAGSTNGILESPSKKHHQNPASSSSDIEQLEAELLGDLDTISG